MLQMSLGAFNTAIQIQTELSQPIPKFKEGTYSVEVTGPELIK